MKAGGVVWRARRDGIEHGHRGREPRAACGAAAVDPRRSWPARVRCAACLVALGLLPLGAARDRVGRYRTGGTS